MVSAWDLKRLLEMQKNIDLIVLGDLDESKINLIKAHISGTGIRIFPLNVSGLPSGIHELAKWTAGSVINLPSRCN